MYLNPPYIYDAKISYDCADVQSSLLYVGEKMMDITEISQFAKELLEYNLRHPRIFTFLSIPQMRSFHPRVWWEANGRYVPLLKRVAIRLLSQACSASACERNLSAFDAAQTRKRNRLTPEMLEDLVYIRVNSLMLENSANFELEDRRPISLENLAEWDTEVVDGNLDEAINEGFVVVDVQSEQNTSWLNRIRGIGASSRGNYG